MADDVEIGDHSRRFRLAVLVAVLFVLLAAVLAVAALDVSPGGFGLNGPDLSGGDRQVEIDGGDEAEGEPVDIGQVDIGALLEEADIDVEWILEHGGEIPASEVPEGALPADLDPATIPPPPYDIELDQEPVPGNDATVTVTKDDEPVPGVIVKFEGRPVGLTNISGQVTAPVPYVTELDVTAEPLVIVEEEQPPDDSDDDTLASTAGGGPALVGDAEAGAVSPAPTAQARNSSSATFEVPTEVSVVPDKPPLPGRSVTVSVERDGKTIPNLAVYVAGELVGETDADGTVTVQVPHDLDPGDEFDVFVERNEFAGRASVDVAEIDIDIETGLLALPGTSAEITVTAADGEREMGLEGVPVTVTDGGSVIAEGRTDENGTASVGLPWSNSVTASATAYGRTVSTTQSGMLYHLLAVLAVPLAGLVVAGVWLRRNPDRVGGAKSWLVSAVLAAGAALRRAGRRIVAAAERVWGAVVRGTAGLRAGLAHALAQVRAWLTGRHLDRSVSPLLWLLSRGRRARIVLLYAVLAPLRWYYSDSTRADSTEGAATQRQETDSAPGPAAPGVRPGAYERLLRCWQWLVRRAVGRTRTKTPVEVERSALESGLPEGPVRRLRRAFQDVEYGYAEPEETVDSAEDAIATIQAEVDGGHPRAEEGGGYAQAEEAEERRQSEEEQE